MTTTSCILQQRTYKPGGPSPSGYLERHEWADVQHKAGLRQKQCCRCGLWNYPQEMVVGTGVCTECSGRERFKVSVDNG